MPDQPLRMFKPSGRTPPPSGGNRATATADDENPRSSAESAGYMELEGAQKDADCAIVEVEGGVSNDLGCCNLVEPTAGAQKFTCGLCTYVRPVAGGGKP